MNYNYFRTYNRSIHRYTTSDPVGLQDHLNTYSCVQRIDRVELTVVGNTTVLEYNIDYAPFGPVKGLTYVNGFALP